jgi:hypothetical protein
MSRPGRAVASLVAALRRARARDPRLFAVRAALGLAALAALGYVLDADNPWEDGLVARLREGKPLRPIEWARAFDWWCTAANAVLLAGLAATARRWLGPAAVAAGPGAPAAPRAPAWLALAVACAMAASGVLAWPRLSLSLWDDEEIALGCCVDGAWERDERTGELRHRDVPLHEVWWASHEGHNHVLQSLLSRLSLDAWRILYDQPRESLASERALRLPSWLAGIASVALVAAFAWRLGLGAAAAAGSAWLLALHPWHVRYASEARGYALLFALLPASWLLLLAALRRGTWPRWLGHAAAQVALIWTHPSMVWQVGLTGLAALAGLWRVHRGTPRLREQAARCLVAHLLLGAAIAELALPHLAQVAVYLGRFQGEVRGFGGPLLESTLAHLLSGAPWRSRDPEHYIELADVAARAPLLLRAAIGVALAAGAGGALRILRAGGARAALVPALLLPAPILYTVSWLRADRFFEWYVVFALPGLATLVAAGLTWPAEALRAPRARAAAGVACVAGFLALFAAVTAEPLAALRSRSIVPLRESVLLTRPSLDPLAPENARIVTLSFQRPAYYYDPLFRWLTTRAELEAQLAQADARGDALFVNIRFGLASKRLPELVRIVEEDPRFERVGVLHGYIHGNERRVYRYRGRGATPAPVAGPDTGS